VGGITGRGRRSRSFVSRCAKLASAQPADACESRLEGQELESVRERDAVDTRV
jgi:hypothetical protein